MKKLVVLFVIAWSGSFTFGQVNYGEIVGKLYEKKEDNFPAYNATVWVNSAGARILAKVDMNGRFKISAVPPGVYELNAVYMDDSLKQHVVAHVKADGIYNVGELYIYDEVQKLETVEIRGALKEPLIDFGDVGVRRISAEDIAISPLRNDPKALIASRNSDIKMDDDGQLFIRGSRGGDLVYFIDGVKMGDVQPIPSAAIGGMTIYTSAIPAKYGDTTGGVIIMETKSYFDLLRMRRIQQRKAERAKESKKKSN